MFKTNMCNYCKELKLLSQAEDLGFFMRVLKRKISKWTKQGRAENTHRKIIMFMCGWLCIFPVSLLSYDHEKSWVWDKNDCPSSILFHLFKNMLWQQQTEQHSPGVLFPGHVLQLLLLDITIPRPCDPRYNIPLVCPTAPFLFNMPGLSPHGKDTETC